MNLSNQEVVTTFKFLLMNNKARLKLYTEILDVLTDESKVQNTRCKLLFPEIGIGLCSIIANIIPNNNRLLRHILDVIRYKSNKPMKNYIIPELFFLMKDVDWFSTSFWFTPIFEFGDEGWKKRKEIIEQAIELCKTGKYK